MSTLSTEDLRVPHPDQARVDPWSAETLRRTAEATRVREAGFLSPRRGLVPALRGGNQLRALADKVEPAQR